MGYAGGRCAVLVGCERPCPPRNRLRAIASVQWEAPALHPL